MQGDVLGSGLKKLGNLSLRQPKAVVVKAALDSGVAALSLEEDDRGLMFGFWLIFRLPAVLEGTVSFFGFLFDYGQILDNLRNFVRVFRQQG